MVDPQCTTMMIDTGQEDSTNATRSQNNGIQEEQRTKLVENVTRNHQNEQTTMQIQGGNRKIEIHGLTIDM